MPMPRKVLKTSKIKKTFNFTIKQLSAIKVIASHLYTLLEGGSRSGKTFLAIWVIIHRAIKYPGTDHLVARQVFAHAKASLWLKTIPDVLRICYPGVRVKLNNSDFILTLIDTDSRVWLFGLDDKERTEKVLGNEYATIFLNEASQISYLSYTTVITRLNPPKDVPPRLIIDYNPPSKKHWGFLLFHRHVEPLSGEPLKKTERFGRIKMNPSDNLANLSEGYIDTLKDLPPDRQARFLHGEYVDPTGLIYKEFLESMIIDREVECAEYIVGVDLITYAAVLIGILAERVYILDEIGGGNMLASELNTLMVGRWQKYLYTAYLDWNLGEAGTREFAHSVMAEKGAGSVEAGISLIRDKMDKGKFFIHNKCYRTRGEIESYRRDENGKIIKADDHYCDAARMAIYSTRRKGAGGTINVY